MAICEYCGRLHQVQVPDYRFCSVFCRQQHQQFLEAAGYTPDGTPTLLDYALTEADYLAHHLVSLAQLAVILLEEEKPEEEVIGFIERIAQGNTVAEKIHRFTAPYLLLSSRTPKK